MSFYILNTLMNSEKRNTNLFCILGTLYYTIEGIYEYLISLKSLGGLYGVLVTHQVYTRALTLRQFLRQSLIAMGIKDFPVSVKYVFLYFKTMFIEITLFTSFYILCTYV